MKNKENYSVFISSLIIAFLIAASGYIALSSFDTFNLNYKYQIIYPPSNKKIYSKINLKKANVEVKNYEIKDK